MRLTFKAFHDVLKAQGEAIKTLERAVDNKANKAEVNAALQQRHAANDFAAQLAELSSSIAGKADAVDVAAQLDRRAMKSDVHAAFQAQEELMNYGLAQKADNADVGALKDGHARALSTLRAELRERATVADVAEVASRVDAKAGRAEVDRALERKVDAGALDALLADRPTKSEMNTAAARAETSHRAALDKASDDMRAELAAAMDRLRADVGGSSRDSHADRRRDLDEMRESLSREMVALKEFGRELKAEFDDRTGRGRGEMERLAVTQREMKEDIGRLREGLATQSTAFASRLETVVSAMEDPPEGRGGAGRVAADELWDELSRKADKHDVAECRSLLETKSDTAQVNAALLQKANIAAVNQALERVERGRAEFATKEDLSQKSDMKDVCALVDVKVGVDDVNQALAEVSRELELKCSVSALEAAIREQGVINSSLCAECSVGRWIWKSGQVKPGNGVPWNVQSVNTDPENFVWERDKVSILTMAPGLYEVTFGFFVRKKPAIQLLVNGEPVLAAVNSASYVLHHSSGRLTSVGRHPAGNVTGLTLIDFLALPPKARIAITYNGEEGGEGFLSLKKL